MLVVQHYQGGGSDTVETEEQPEYKEVEKSGKGRT